MKQTVLFLFMILNLTIISFSQYVSPESVTYDSLYNRYLVTNSNGKIMQRSSNGSVTDFVSSSGGTHGIAVFNGVAYACQGATVRGFALSNAAQVFTATLSGASFLNGIAIDNNGMIYLSDFTNKRIYKLNSSNGAYWQYVTNTVNTPNGLVLDPPRNRLIICCWGSNAPVKAINLSDSSMSTLITTSYGNCDGIKLDKYNNVYISTWSPARIIRYDINFSLPVTEVVTSGLSNPADIFINKWADTLAVPNSGNSTVTFHFIGNISGIETVNSNIPSKFMLHQNYPNPFNPSTVIKFEITEGNSITLLNLYDINGRLVKELVRSQLNPGIYKYNLNAADLPSGIYFYRLYNNKSYSTKKLTLIK